MPICPGDRQTLDPHRFVENFGACIVWSALIEGKARQPDVAAQVHKWHGLYSYGLYSYGPFGACIVAQVSWPI